MRINWRRRLVVTAFAAVSMLPFAGCSSQQQQATDEVVAEGQQGDGEEGEDQTAQTQQGGDETAAADEATGNPTEDMGAGSENMASSNVPTEDTGSSDLNEIISEMNGSGNAPVANAAAPAEAIAEAAPVTEAPVTEVAQPTPAPQQEATVSVGGLPEMGSKMAYVVEPGDTLAKISTKIFGDQKRWKEIAGLSGLDNPNHIYPGDLVYYTLDEHSQTFAQTYETVKRAKETVRDGDTLVAIAKRVYGDSKLWKHIWRQNDHIDNPDKLSAGMTVYYVESGSFKTASKKASNVTIAKKSATSNSKSTIKSVSASGLLTASK